MAYLKSPFLWSILALLASAGLAASGPQEKFLGGSVRIVYLHGAWALTAQAALGLSAACGLTGVLLRRAALQRWSAGLGYTGLFFWITSVPLSLWAMQANWNGLFLAEPRLRVAVIFAITGILLQGGLALLARPVFTGLSNALYFAALEIALARAGYVMHPPPSPIFNSGNLGLEVYFIFVILLIFCAAAFMTLGWLQKRA